MDEAGIAYNLQDSQVTFRLDHKLLKELRDRGLEGVYEKERRVLPLIAKAMRDGIMLAPASVEAQRHNGAIQKGGSGARRS